MLLALVAELEAELEDALVPAMACIRCWNEACRFVAVDAVTPTVGELTAEVALVAPVIAVVALLPPVVLVASSSTSCSSEASWLVIPPPWPWWPCAW